VATFTPVGGSAGLYEIDLTTGAATLLGGVAERLSGLALAGPAGYCAAGIFGKVVCKGGSAGDRGIIPGLLEPVIDAVATPNGQGVWQVALDGGVFSSGDAQFYGSIGGTRLNEPVIGIASTPSGRGYWEIAAPFLGSAGGLPLNSPVQDIAHGGPNGGYRLLALDGGIFNYGPAGFAGTFSGRDVHLGLAG